MLNGRDSRLSRVAVLTDGSILSSSGAWMYFGSIGLRSASEVGREGIVGNVSAVENMDDMLGDRELGRETKDASESVRAENDMLGGRDAEWEAVDAGLLGDEGLSVTGGRGFMVFKSGCARKEDMVLDLRSPGFSSVTSGAFFSGSLNSSFPFLSEAKYSSPRPKTTCNEAKSRVVLSLGQSHSWSAGGRSYPSKGGLVYRGGTNRERLTLSILAGSVLPADIIPFEGSKRADDEIIQTLWIPRILRDLIKAFVKAYRGAHVALLGKGNDDCVPLTVYAVA